MSDGWWRIKQHAPNAPGGFLVTEIRIAAEDSVRPDGIVDRWTSPGCSSNSDHLKFVHRDGREEYFPWASIVHAEYQPPTDDKHPDLLIKDEDW